MSNPNQELMKSVETRKYSDPYHVTRQDGGTSQLLFARMDGVLDDCSHGNNPEDRGPFLKTLDMTIIQPGNLHEHGLPTDSQFLPTLAVNTKHLCNELKLNFHLSTRISWECDHRFLGKKPTGNIWEIAYREELKNIFGADADTDQGIGRLWEKMEARRVQLLAEAINILTTHNLIVIGSPSVNKVMVNLCDLFLTQSSNLADLGMYLFPAVGRAPLRLRRRKPSGQWEEFQEKTLEHRDIGWAHMIRNPWAKDNNRFLIYVGGFYPQGTSAAMRKRVNISDELVGLRGKEKQAELIMKTMLRNRSDHFIGETGTEDTPNAYIPAHILKAKLNPPSSWFFGKPSPPSETSWTKTLPSYDGNVKEYIDM